MTAFQDIDVFLCHNSKDKPVVLKIAEALQQSGLNIWIDRHSIFSGEEFQRAIQQAIPNSKSAAIFFSSHEEGPWQSLEIDALEREMAKRGMLLIPILLPGVNQIPNERLFLQGRNWLSLDDDENIDQEFLEKLVRSIKTQNLSNLADNLSSERRVNYTQLRDFLKAGRWIEADKETFAVMLQATGREKAGSLSIESIKNFPCTDLSTIDQLWVKYSQGRFGFSVQKRIWESEGKDYRKYGHRVGWLKGMLDWLAYNQLTFSIKARQGHLPAALVWNGEWRHGGGWGVMKGFDRSCISSLASRLVKCDI